MDNFQEIQGYFTESIRVKREVAKHLVRDIDAVARVMAAALKGKKKILFFGNGGSAADSQHLAAEFIGRFRVERGPLPAIALTTDSSILTAIGNDFGYDQVFVRQIRGLGMTGDIAIGISTSGNSENVIKGLEAAKEMGLITVGMTGGDGGKMGPIVEHHLNVSATKTTAHIQESHITIGHIIMELVDQALGLAIPKVSREINV